MINLSTLTPEQKKTLRNDPKWRRNKLYSIVDKNSKRVPFRENRAQQEFNDDPHPRKINLKARQLGSTTGGVVVMFDKTCFKPNHASLFIGHLKGEAENIFDNKISVLWDTFPLQSLYTPSSNKRGELRLNFGKDPEGNESESFIRVSTSARSGTYNHVHITELAKMEREERAKAVEIVRGTIPAVPIDGYVTIESTAEGDHGLFFNLFMDAWERERPPLPTEFKAFFFNWTYDDDEIAKIKEFIPLEQMEQRDFFEERKRRFSLTDQQLTYYYLKWVSLNKDFEALLQEYPSTVEEAFRSSGNKFFTQQFLDLQMVRPAMVSGDWKFYSKRDTSHVYVMGVDPSGGVGKDNAVIVVLDLSTGEVAAEYVSKYTSPRELAFEAVTKAKLYNNCLLGVESNNHGLATLYECQNLNYGNLYNDTTYDRYTNEEKKVLGFRTDARTKPLILHAVKEALNTFALRIPSKSMLRELRSYQREQLDTLQLDEELGHFDRVMALAIAWHMRLSAPSTGKITASSYA